MATRERTRVDSTPSLILLSKRAKGKEKPTSQSNTREEPRAGKRSISMSREPAIKYLDLLNCNGDIELRQSKTSAQYSLRSTTDVGHPSMHSSSTSYPADCTGTMIRAKKILKETMFATINSEQNQEAFAALGALFQDVTQVGGDYSHVELVVDDS